MIIFGAADGSINSAQLVFAATILIAYVFTLYLLILSFGFAKRSRKLWNILYIELDPEKFINETQIYLSRIKNAVQKNVLRMNLALGYEALRDYTKAVSMMQSVSANEISGIYKLIYHTNLAVFYAKLKDIESAENHFTECEKLIPHAQSYIVQSGEIDNARGVISYHTGDFDKAQASFETALKAVALNPVRAVEIKLYLSKIYIQTGSISDARRIIQGLSGERMLPCDLDEYKMLAECLN